MGKTMREMALAMAARPTATDPRSRSVLCSANPSVGGVALDIASGMNYSSGVLVSTKGEVFVIVETPATRCVLLLDDELLAREVAAHGDFTLIAEGQIPVRVRVPTHEQSALHAYARARGW